MVDEKDPKDGFCITEIFWKREEDSSVERSRSSVEKSLAILRIFRCVRGRVELLLQR